MTEPQHRSFDLRTMRTYLAELGPEGRKNLTIVLAWFTAMLVAAMSCGIAIGLLL